ncbi:MAG: CotH kinase family protein [Bacteroidetes bacterium]|nr:CotH kinase family protein [Bacteroidota bacterium]MBL6944589.1 CotH kinase family protein [Bacteroidales bacterium]
MKKITTLFVLLIVVTTLKSQTIFPDNGPLYNDEIVPRIDITVNPDTLAWLYQYENLLSNIEFTARFIFNDGEIIDTIEPVGFRLRGNTSRYSNKKSFKVSFNTFTSGGKYYGVEKLNLNGEHNDPSVIRSKVCWDILRKMEIPAPRANHVRVYINGNYYGLYISVEHIDEEFVKTRFTYNDGNLYKCLYPADLNYLGEDPDLYKFESGDRRAYELKINEEADDYSGLAHFIDVLNNTPAENLKCDLDEVFNTYDYLKVIASDVLFGNWDGYIYNQNNYYVYHNSTTNKFEYIPYDLDNTLGIDWLDRDWGTRNMYDWQQHGDHYRPLYERVMNNQELRDQYTYYMNQLITETLDIDSLITAIGQRRDMIAPYLTIDPYYPLDYGYDMNDFYDSYTIALGGHVDYGLFPFLQTRVNAIIDQLENTNMLPVIKYIKHQRSSASEVWVRAYTDVANLPATVNIAYTIEGQGSLEQTMYDDGLHNDGEAGDYIFGGLIGDIPENSSLTYQIRVMDNEGRETTMPCEPVFVPQSGGSDVMLYINEFLTSNEASIADEHGDFDDWIEVYNAEDITVWLGDKYMTDNLTQPNKWQLPDAYIEPGAFQIIWADDEPDQGPFHATFKLSKDGEDIGLFDANMFAIDEYIFGPQTTDISEGRLPDGGPDWVLFEQPTPGASNESSDINGQNESSSFVLYPNPAHGDVVHLSSPLNYAVYNIYGQIVGKALNYDKINISEYNKGVYIVVSDKGEKGKLIIN